MAKQRSRPFQYFASGDTQTVRNCIISALQKESLNGCDNMTVVGGIAQLTNDCVIIVTPSNRTITRRLLRCYEQLNIDGRRRSLRILSGLVKKEDIADSDVEWANTIDTSTQAEARGSQSFQDSLLAAHAKARQVRFSWGAVYYLPPKSSPITETSPECDEGHFPEEVGLLLSAEWQSECDSSAIQALIRKYTEVLPTRAREMLAGYSECNIEERRKRIESICAVLNLPLQKKRRHYHRNDISLGGPRKGIRARHYMGRRKADHSL